MAYIAGNLALISSVNGYGLYRYDTLDTLTTVDAIGYFNNVDDNLNLAKGDIILVTVWAGAVRSGNIVDHGYHQVIDALASGIVSITEDYLGITPTTAD